MRPVSAIGIGVDADGRDNVKEGFLGSKTIFNT